MTSPVVVRYPAARLLLLVAALVLFIVFGMIGAGWFTSDHPDAFLGFGLAAFAGSFL